MPRRNLRLMIALTLFCLVCATRASRHGQVLVFAMRQIQERALEPVGEQELFAGALEGMMGRLDPYSVYIPPKLLSDFEETLTQEFGGVGLEILLDPETGELTVASPLPDTPAQRAGVRSGDKILKIDGESTKGMSLEDARDRMRGAPGDPVTLTVLHPHEEEPVDIRIVRDVIKVGTVWGDRRNENGVWNYMLEDHPGLAYVRISSFSEETAHELQQVIRRLLDQEGMKALILDLRNNPGGLLEAAIEICDLFVASGQIVSTRDRDGRVRSIFHASQSGTLPQFPMVVLINQLSASASEIVAACLQDHRRAAVVGQRSFGKGTVQEIIRLERPDGVLKLTTASYWRP
ncbi:MAG TPA: S41 family peptidase, partial [Planctomycetaceae bacterium]|nr:S41 family peptidase [Planctomycetaceae bacterium]